MRGLKTVDYSKHNETHQLLQHTHKQIHTHTNCVRETYFGYGRCNHIPKRPFTHIERDASTVQNRFWKGIEPHIECSHSINSWSHQFPSPTHAPSMYWVTLAKLCDEQALCRPITYTFQLQVHFWQLGEIVNNLIWLLILKHEEEDRCSPCQNWSWNATVIRGQSADLSFLFEQSHDRDVNY